MDKHFYKLAFITLALISLGSFKSLKREEDWGVWHYIGAFSLSNSTIVIILFLYIQKRVHKEVFLEMR
tara:strand:+ start:476 stop:679 length:204 start_codon:yes stop_codon:yes gene_type:complete